MVRPWTLKPSSAEGCEKDQEEETERKEPPSDYVAKELRPAQSRREEEINGDDDD